ncbi:MAG: DapH/DapD/GlmU-related protein [Candidatus Anstonellales archaeon]
MRRLQITKVSGKNSLHLWWRVKNPLRTAFNYCLIQISKKIPSLSIKNLLLSLTGIRIGKDVSIAPDVDFDFLYPELIEVGENSIIGYGAVILAHEFLIDQFRVGRVRIGKNVVVGARSILLAGIEIRDNATVGAGSIVTKNNQKARKDA